MKRMSRLWMLTACALVPFAFCFLNASVCAAEKKDPKKETEEEKEAKKAAEEEAREAATSGLAFKPVTLKGRVELIPIQDGDTINTVAGAFTTNQGSFLLRFETMALRRALLRENPKEAVLNGKIRNDGKYFVVTSIEGGNGQRPTPVVTPGSL
ncbi:MAG: hypothetical protein NTW87_03575 [Planctomycetota bacterium]|nr:hypothetical protein [Planctomycetota bacterium]